MDAVKILGQLMGNSNGVGGNLIGSLLGGGQQQAGSQGGGLGGMLSGLTGGGQQSGGLGGMLSGLTGGGQGGQQGGGLGDLLSGLTGGAQQGGSSPLGGLSALLGGGGNTGGGLAGGGLASILGAAMGHMGGNQAMAQEAVQAMPAEEVDEGAKLMIQAMINAAKCDGEVDRDEQEKILSKLGNDLSEEEINYVREQMSSPLDVDAFIQSIPRGAEQQVYAFSLFGMTLDTQVEAQYMAKLAEVLRIDAETANQIHAQIGAPKIFN